MSSSSSGDAPIVSESEVGEGTEPLKPEPAGPSNKPATLAFGAIGVVIVVFAVAVFFRLSNQPETTVSEAANSEFLLDSGGTGTLSDFEGTPVVLNFFASWCAPCRAELPDFEAVHQDMGDQVTFLGINHDSTEESWRGFVETTQVTYQTAFQPQRQLWQQLDGISLPFTVFVGAAGEVEFVHNGVLSQKRLRELINTHLLESQG